VKWGKEVERIMKQRNLTPDDAVNRHVWRVETSNWWITGELIVLRIESFSNI
jgi:hypothetical protein